MKKILNFFKTFFGAIGILLMYVAVFYGEIFGMIHSARKHSNGDLIATVFIPPWSWYRSAELWWHDDNADWDKKLGNDMKNCFYLLNEIVYEKADVIKLNNDALELSNKIKEYPESKKKYLINGCKAYINYQNLSSKDVLTSMWKYYETGALNFLISPTTKKMEVELTTTYKLKDEIEFSNKQLEDLTNQLNNEQKLNLTLDQIEDLKMKFKSANDLLDQNKNLKWKTMFKQIFDKEL